MKNSSFKVLLSLMLIGFASAFTALITFVPSGCSLQVKQAQPEAIKTQQTKININIFSKKFSEKKNYAAVVNITGAIQEKGPEYNQKWLLSTIQTLKEDEKNSAIILFIDSPGGTVYHSDEAYLALKNYKSSGKKVYAYFATMAASGGYYIGCSADKIYANRNCITGSIGVISASAMDATELLKKLGIKSKTIHAGKNKNMLNYNEPMTDEQIAIMQSLADECYDQFTEIVAESREMRIEDVRKLADGRIFSAKQAKENGLIDDVLTFDDCKLLVSKELNIDYDSFKYFKYSKPDNLRSILMEAISFIKNPQAAWTPGSAMYYLYTTY